MNFDQRKQQLDAAEQIVFDAVVVGGGISGAVVFRHLAEQGYRVLLLEKGDFAGGTSQSSAMMVWGNLTDLRTLSLLKVGRSCALRETLIRKKSDWVFPQKFRYLPVKNGRKPLSSSAAFYTYWLLGAGRRTFPRYRENYAESAFLKNENFAYSFEYEEAVVEPSDARFVLSWILNQSDSLEQTALNYCRLDGGYYNFAEKCWCLEITDLICDKEVIVKTKGVINAAGVWTDSLNCLFGITSPYKHVFGKGVFLGIKRPAEHHSTLMIETRESEGCLALIPWGQISLWGPTETRVSSPDEGFSVTPEDVSFLLYQLNRHLSASVSTKDIVSLRCGIRPLPVEPTFSETDSTLCVPRDYKIHADSNLPWISIYGGKLTSCVMAAKRVESLLKNFNLTPGLIKQNSSSFDISRPELESYPNLYEKVPSARWCAEKEKCWKLEDYLRRRTNISQWIKRGGLGANNEHLPHLRNLTAIFGGSDENKINEIIKAYQQKIGREFDEVLGCVDILYSSITTS
jgi:glycerol-3-phosphate dehydrogenase